MSLPADSHKPLLAFLDRLTRFVRDEYLAQRRQIDLTWRKPIGERVAAGRAIEGVRVVGLSPEGGLQLACARNASRFREGDILCLNQGDPNFHPKIKVTLTQDRETQLGVAPAEIGPDLVALVEPGSIWALDEDTLDLSQIIVEALGEAGDRGAGIQRILPLLMGDLRPGTDLARYERALQQAEDVGLNDDQAEAFAQAYATDLAWLVQGPPGTGKTRVLAHLAAALAEEGERVLITGFTHRAINNALNRLYPK